MLSDSWAIKTRAHVSCLSLMQRSNDFVAVVGFKNPSITCYSIYDQAILWNFILPDGFVSSRSTDFDLQDNHQLAADLSVTVYSSSGGKIGNAWSKIAFIDESGNMIKSTFLPEKVQNIVVYDKKVFILTRDTFLNVFSHNGEFLWSFSISQKGKSYHYAYFFGPKENKLIYVRGHEYCGLDMDGKILWKEIFPSVREVVGFEICMGKMNYEKNIYKNFPQIFGSGDISKSGDILFQTKKGNFYKVNLLNGFLEPIFSGPPSRTLKLLQDDMFCFSDGVNLYFSDGGGEFRIQNLKPSSYSLIYAEKADLLFNWGGYKEIGYYLNVYDNFGGNIWSWENSEPIRCGVAKDDGIILAMKDKISFFPYSKFRD